MKKTIMTIFVYLFLSIAAFISIFPFIWMIISTTNPSIAVTGGRMLPGSYFMENWNQMIYVTDFSRAFLNTVRISVITTVLALLISSIAGYGFEIYKSKTRDIIFNILLGSMMIPFAALMVPMFRMFANVPVLVPIFGINSHGAIILPGIATAFLIFFFRQSTKMFPREILEAGRIDGLSELGIFVKIYMPTMKTTYAAAGIITFMTSWNNFLWPLIVVQSPEQRTLTLLISNLGAGFTPDYGVIMLAIVLATIPVAIVFFVLQKHFVAGMMGSVK